MLYQRTFLIELNLYTLMSIVWIIPFETIRRKAFQKTVRDLQNEIFFNKESTAVFQKKRNSILSTDSLNFSSSESKCREREREFKKDHQRSVALTTSSRCRRVRDLFFQRHTNFCVI